MSFVKSRLFYYFMSAGFKIRDTLTPREKILAEVNLKPEGTFSFNDHHMKESDIKNDVEGSGFFELTKKHKMPYQFSPKTSE